MTATVVLPTGQEQGITMKKWIAALAAFATGVALASVASAQSTAPAAAPAAPAAPTPDWVVAYNVGAQTDYVFRGLSQTGGKASLFGGIDATYKGQFYVGTWTSNLDFKKLAGDTKTNEEVDLYGGWRPTVDGYNFDFGVQYYGYMHQPKGAKVDYTEVYAKVSKAFGNFTPGAAIYYSNQYSYHSGKGYYAELNGSYTLDPAWSVSGALGHYEYSDLPSAASYNTWNAGVTWGFMPHLGLDVRYYDTDAHKFYGSPGKGRFVAQLKATY